MKYRYGKAEDEQKVGVTTGLAWTELGGELLATEVTIMPGKGQLIITGKLGDVMQESAQAAMSYVRSRATRAWVWKKTSIRKSMFISTFRKGRSLKTGLRLG